MKYPWKHDPADPKRSRKWSVYPSEEEDFQWARELGPEDGACVEARLMDLADDIAYAVHDLEDFFRARLLPLDRLKRDEEEQHRIVDQVFKRWEVIGKRTEYTKGDLAPALDKVMRLSSFKEPYAGTRSERAALRMFTAGLIRSYVGNVHLDPKAGGIAIDPGLRAEIDILKELTWQYVILDSRMVARDLGQRRVIQTLLRAFDHEPALFPVALREERRSLEYSADPRADAKRLVIDAVASMNDLQALHLYHRLTGHALGSLEDAFRLG
jgi:dGTPase